MQVGQRNENFLILYLNVFFKPYRVFSQVSTGVREVRSSRCRPFPINRPLGSEKHLPCHTDHLCPWQNGTYSKKIDV